MKEQPIGTVIQATMRPQDLIPAFLEVMAESDPAAYQQLMIPGAGFPAVPSYAMEDQDSDWWNSDDCAYLLEQLFDCLMEYAPPYCYFGSHPGDGSDYGYWPDLKAIS